MWAVKATTGPKNDSRLFWYWTIVVQALRQPTCPAPPPPPHLPPRAVVCPLQQGLLVPPVLLQGRGQRELHAHVAFKGNTQSMRNSQSRYCCSHHEDRGSDSCVRLSSSFNSCHKAAPANLLQDAVEATSDEVKDSRSGRGEMTMPRVSCKLRWASLLFR